MQNEGERERLTRMQEQLKQVREAQEEAKGRHQKMADALQTLQTQQVRQEDKLDLIMDRFHDQRALVRRLAELEDSDKSRKEHEDEARGKQQRRRALAGKGALAFVTAILSGLLGGDQLGRLFTWFGSHLK